MEPTSAGAQRSHGAASGPVAVDLLNQDVVRGTLHGNTLVLVADLNIVDPDVGAPDINTIQASLVAAVDDQVVQLTILAGIEREMEERRWGQVS